jgi:DNA-binding NtrC family response regulator
MRNEYLIVDDEIDICWAIQNILRLRGVSSRIALSAREAIALTQLHRFSLAFLDVTLPDMNGFELAGHLRALDPEIRLVIISGYLPVETAAIARAHDARFFHGCIIKPFMHDDILSFVAGESDA